MAKVADGIRYAERVVAGEIVAGEFVRLACQRFLDDLKYGEERGIYFSEPRAQHILNFYKFVPHVKGALAGQPIELMDWHVFILINIFGFVIPLVNEETGEVVMRSDGSGLGRVVAVVVGLMRHRRCRPRSGSQSRAACGWLRRCAAAFCAAAR